MHEDFTDRGGVLPPEDARLSDYLSDHLRGVLTGSLSPDWGRVRLEIVMLPPLIAYTVAFMLRWLYADRWNAPASPAPVSPVPPAPAAERVAGPPPTAYET